jgi:dihydropteroate synthase
MTVLHISGKTFDLKKQTLLMGVLNVTPDSFSDGGSFYSLDKAVDHAVSMEKEGADIIDIGGESTRPGADKVSLGKEMNRVLPVIEELVSKVKVPLSIDTYKAEVARKALDLGVGMVNDISALRGDKNLAHVVAEYDVPVVLMHMKGTPKNMQVNPVYSDVVKEIRDFLHERVTYARSQGIKKKNIIVDPGLGFGKRTGAGVEDNCEIIQRLSELKTLGYPVLVGASRKTFIGNVCGRGQTLPVSERLEGSLAVACLAVLNGADVLRVHDVQETQCCLDLVECIMKE